MTTAPEVAALREAYREAAVTDLDRAHDLIVADVVARTGVDAAGAAAALPRLASREWQREFSPSRDAPPIPDGMTVDDALDILRSSADASVRAQAVSDALAYADGPVASVALAALDDPAAHVRRIAVRRSWLVQGSASELRTRISELVARDPDVGVRAAAMQAVALSGDESPLTVTALLETASPSNDRTLRIAAARALATNARGYARICRALLRWAGSEQDVPVRDAFYDAAARLAAEADWPHLVAALMEQATRDMRVGLHLRPALRESPATRVAVRDAAMVLLGSADAATRVGAVHLISGSTFLGDEVDRAAHRGVEALADDPDERVRTAVFVTAATRGHAKDTTA